MNPKTPLLAVLAVLAAVAAVAAGCGSDEKTAGSTTGAHTTAHAAANATDAGFVADMSAHHQDAIDMARIAQKRAEHPQVKRLANDIVTAQRREIVELKRIKGHMGAAASQGSEHMGMSKSEMGMDMDPAMLEHAKPFDREFIDMMIPHHRGAIAMSRQLVKEGSDAALRKMASDIIRAQSAEIGEMRAWRADWYGSGSGSGSTSMGS